MKLEIWMIVGIGIAFAIGLGAITVMLLGLHAEVRRLSKLAEGAQRILAANLRQVLPAVAAPKAHNSRAPDPPPRVTEPDSQIVGPSLAMLALATAAKDPQPSIGAGTTRPEPATGGAARLDWNPDRRLLVVRLASRGQLPEQIAAALRIPEQEVEQFLEANSLLAKKQTAVS